MSSKMKRNFAGPFRVVEKIGKQSHKLELLNEWRIHNVFHRSLLKNFSIDKFQQVLRTCECHTNLEESNKPIYEVENIL